MADSKDCLDKNVEENIKFISSKIIEKKTILFLGAGFSANFGFPLWKELLISIIEKIENEFQDLDDYYKKELKNLKSMVQNNFDLSRVLDNLKSLLDTNLLVPIEKKDDASAFFIKEYNSKLDIDIVKKEIDSEKKEILELINNNFDKIITTNYDNIFAWSELEKPKQYIKNWINSIEELSDKVYPIHGSITGIKEKSNETSEHKVNNLNKKDKKIEFIDTYKSFIENWIIENFTESFKKIIEDAVNQNYTFIFLGYSFEDQFVANSLATFILEKAKVKTLENKNFVVLFNDYEKQKNKCDCYDKCKVNVSVVLSTKYVKCDKKPPLDSKLYGIKYIKFSKIFNSEECINLFEVIKKFLNYIKEYANIYDLLNEIDLVFNHEVINESKNFNFEEYFKSDKINAKFENKQELLFIIDFFGKKYDLLNSKITYKEKYIDGILNNLFDWLHKNKEISLSQDIVQFLGKSKLYIKLLKWRINDKEIRKWLGEFV